MDKHKSIVVVGLILINSCSFALIAVLLMLWLKIGRSDAKKFASWLDYRSREFLCTNETLFAYEIKPREKRKSRANCLSTKCNWKIQSDRKRRWRIATNVNSAEEISSSGSFTMLVSLARRMSMRLTRSGQSLKASWGLFEAAFDDFLFLTRVITLKRVSRSSFVCDIDGDA